MSLCQALDARDLLAFLFRVHDIDRQVRPVEAADECLRFDESQLLDDVGTNVRRGRRGERKGLRLPPKLEGLNHAFKRR